MTVYIDVVKGSDSQLCRLPTSTLGQLTVGPERLLEWLESQLGLERPVVSFTTRMVQYLSCLLELDGPDRFYHESLRQDEFGVARTLLQWRDTWYEAGWTGQAFREGSPARLRDMGEVEQLAAGTITHGLGQRVQLVSEALTSITLDVAITLRDSMETFPEVWQRLFTQLGAQESPWRAEPQCRGQSDLARLQRELLSDREADQQIRLAGDGSVLVLHDGSPQLSAPWIARFAHRQLGETDSVAILAMRNGATLDDALTDAGYPRLGFSEPSVWRPVFQVLPLSLELLWRPLDPAVLLQFLAHPMSPVPALIRRRLAEVVATEPGIGSESWHKALEAALDDMVAKEPEQTAGEKRDQLAQVVGFWLESERFEPQSGAPLLLLKSRIQRVGAWLSSAWAVFQDESVSNSYSAALGQCDELERTIDRLMLTGKENLTRESVRRLVEAVRGSGVVRPGRPWQCADGKPQLLRADSPAGVVEPASVMIWWGCDEERFPSVYPWSQSELAALSEHGVELLSLKVKLEWQAGTWLRPILSAKERLVLVLHDNAESHHPIFDQISAVAQGWNESHISQVMGEPATLPMDSALPEVQEIAQQTLPMKTRWWQLADGVSLDARKVESYSSLERFLFGPYQWVLNYTAKIRPGALAELNDGPLLKGSLAHGLFERFFTAHCNIAAIDPEEARQWAALHLNELIEKSGAVLLTPGRKSEKEDFVVTVTRALIQFIRHLQSANVVQASMEQDYLGRFCGGALQGTLDMHVTNANGESAIVDIKWGGLNYRRKTFEESSYLQLAVYALLVHQSVDQWPVLANFIIREGQLLVLESSFFPHASVERTANGENLLEFWRRVESTWRWRREQLDQGLIEVTITDTEPDEWSSPGDLGLPMPETFDAFDDFQVLTGWGGQE